MSDEINGVGTLSFVNGSPTFFGGQSGFDTETLINSLVQVRQLPAVSVETRISENQAKIAAFNDLKTNLTAMSSALNGLRNPPGFFGSQDNVFEAKSVFLSGGATDPTTIAAVTVDGTAAAGTFDLTVNRLAKAEKFTATTASDTNALGYSGTINIGLDSTSYTATDVAIAAGDTIFDIRDKFNAVSTVTGVGASVIQTSSNPSSPSYQLVFSAAETGLAINYTDSVGTLISGGSMAKTPLQAATTAQIVVDGVTVERTGNDIADVLDGVSITLLREQPADPISVEVGTNLNSVKDKIVEFVDAYNAYRSFVDTQQVVDEDGVVGTGAALFGNSTLRSTVGDVAFELSRGVGGVQGFSTLAEIGISLDASNRLVIDNTALDNAILTNLDQVRDVFEFQLTSSSTELQVLEHEGDVDFSAFDIQINNMNADGSGITVSNLLDSSGSPMSGTANPFTVEGNTLIGRAGTEFEGLKLVYTGAAAGETVNVTGVSQGIADRLYNRIEQINDIDGPINQEVVSLDDRNVELAEEVQRIQQRAEDYRLSLIDRFAALEAAIAASNSLLDQVRSVAESLNGDN